MQQINLTTYGIIIIHINIVINSDLKGTSTLKNIPFKINIYVK